MKDAFVRLRSSDGFSHARSMAFLLILVFVQAVIAAVGIASALGSGALSASIVDDRCSRSCPARRDAC